MSKFQNQARLQMGKPTATLTVHVWEGKNLASKDSNGLSDPYCSLSTIPTSKPSKQRTKIKKETLNPVWQEAFDFKLENWQATILKIECYDWDRFGSPDFMGQITIPVVDIEGQLIDSFYTLLPREGKKDVVSGKIRVQAYLKILDTSAKGEEQKKYLDLVDKDVAVKMDSVKIACQEVLFQLIQTEKKYLEDLDDIFKTYHDPLQEKSILSDGALEFIFQNLAQIRTLSEVFLKQLQQRQQQDKFVIQKVGDIFQAFIKKCKCYVPYCTNQNLLSGRLSSLKHSHPDFASFLNEAQTNNTLEAILKQPKKRLAKYHSLLEDYFNRLDEQHPDKRIIGECISQLIILSEEINVQIREREFVQNMQHLFLSLEKSGQFSLLTNTEGNNRIIENITKVTIVERALNVVALAILFEDSIAFTKQSKKEPISVIYEFGLLSITVKGLNDCLEYKHSIEIATSELSVRVEMPNAQTKSDWLAMIHEYQQAHLFENMMPHAPVIEESDNESIEQAQKLLEELGGSLPPAYVSLLEAMLGEIGDLRTEREEKKKEIANTRNEIEEYNDRIYRLNKVEAFASAANTNSNAIFLSTGSAQAAAQAAALTAAQTGSAIMGSFMKKPSNLFSTFTSKEEMSPR